jgi:hypothetical protein
MSRYSLVLSTGLLVALVESEYIESFMLARIPAGCSYMRTREARSKLTGILGLDSMDRKRRKSACGLRASMRFSRLCSHVGAR